MLVAAHPDGHVAVAQQAHAWLSGQLARAWGNDRFGAVAPYEEVCLAAEQHDLGMAAFDGDPTLDPRSGLPTSFMNMDLASHLRMWDEGPRALLGQSRYAALLASMHGSALYARRDLAAMDEADRELVASFLSRHREFEAQIRATLAASDEEVARNQRLVWTWDSLSLALILGWAPWTAEQVPAASGDPVEIYLNEVDRRFVLSPWPFAARRVSARTQGRLLRNRCADREQLRRALAEAPWIDLTYELLAG